MSKQKEFLIHESSILPVSPEELWPVVFSMHGVNRELGPWVRMTSPPGRELRADRPGEVLFPSWILLFGLLPVDRHFLRFESVEAGKCFREDSYSWTHHYWRHTRTLETVENGTRLTDEVRFRPRLFFLGRLLRPVYGWVFAHRHRRLAAWCS